MPKGFGVKCICLIKCDLCNFGKVLPKSEAEKHNIYKLSMRLNFQNSHLIDLKALQSKYSPYLPFWFLTLEISIRGYLKKIVTP